MYKILIRKILFLFPPETVHHLIVCFVRLPFISSILKLIYGYEHPALSREVLGMKFRNPVGLAAGFDKDSQILTQTAALGFGFIEIGTVTPLPQAGNPRPRIFRLPLDEALINRMGFNNQGMEISRQRLRNRKAGFIVGGNIGKNRETPNHLAASDYEACFESLYDVVDFFIVNVSSPNTPHLRELQEKGPLTELLNRLKVLGRKKPAQKPLFLKIAPDLNNHQLDEIIDIVKATRTDGIIATNTTIARNGLKTPLQLLDKIGEGGLSGKPLSRRSTEIIRYLRKRLGPDFPIIGVGGIHSGEDALEKFRAGATLIELYTGFIYEGPALLKRIKKDLLKEYYKSA
jgi:dihydroorotate dehydrogenase